MANVGWEGATAPLNHPLTMPLDGLINIFAEFL